MTGESDSVDRRSVLRSLAGAGVVTIGSGTGLASAQSGSGGNSTETGSDATGVDVEVSLSDDGDEDGDASGNATDSGSGDDDRRRILHAIGPTSRIRDYRVDRLDDDRAEVAIDLSLDVPQQVVTSDMFGAISSDSSGGVSGIPQTRDTVGSGESTLSRTVGLWDGDVGLSVATTEGAAWIATGVPRSGTQVSLQTGVMTGVATTVGALLFAVDRKANQSSKAPERSDEGGLL
jgi:hypothetical protein